MALQLRPKCRPISNPSFIHLYFSSSSSTTDTNSTDPKTTTPTSPTDSSSSQSQPSSLSSYFSDVKASLQQQQNPSSQSSLRRPSRSPFNSSSLSTPSKPPTKIASLEEIRKNLSEFRRRSVPENPIPSSSSSSQHISFEELYKRNVIGKQDESSPAKSARGKVGGGVGDGNMSFQAIRESLRQLQKSAVGGTNAERKGTVDPMSISGIRESLKLRPANSIGNNAAPAWMAPRLVIGGKSESLPASVFGKEMREKKEEGSSSSELRMKTEFVKMYSFSELGEKLRMLRPEEKKRTEGNWFSLGELNERLMMLREIEEKEMESKKLGGVPFRDLRASLVKLKMSDDDKAKKSSIQRLDILGQLGGTPEYMLLPPKEHLVEKYFHPNNMSSAEKLKNELEKVRDEFKMSESDCGSSRVQVALLTTKIKHLSSVLHKKDKHSRKGLLAMVQKRKKLLKYLRRTDWDSYCFVLSKLGLRDKPDFLKVRTTSATKKEGKKNKGSKKARKQQNKRQQIQLA